MTSIPTWEDCAAKGMTMAEAAEARGVSVNAACNYSRRNGLAFARADKRPEKYRALPTWLDLSKRNLTAQEAADIRGTSRHQAYVMASKHGFSWRPVPDSEKDMFRSKVSREWKALLDEGLTASEAAARRGVSCSAACDWAERRGLSWAEGKPGRPVAPEKPTPAPDDRKKLTIPELMAAVAKRENAAMRKSWGRG